MFYLSVGYKINLLKILEVFYSAGEDIEIWASFSGWEERGGGEIT
jgi:hypothetical protein